MRTKLVTGKTKIGERKWHLDTKEIGLTVVIENKNIEGSNMYGDINIEDRWRRVTKKGEKKTHNQPRKTLYNNTKIWMARPFEKDEWNNTNRIKIYCKHVEKKSHKVENSIWV